ncbi:MAG TPA: hypothetical protein VJS44_08350 [Pyrinomonadaceae bacterium]|nr:hypothetical protein [Pyrinomonadaceae bacterium]
MNKHFNKVAEQVADKIGSPVSIVLHTLFFIAVYFAPFVYGFSWGEVFDFLTNVVSIEAIYLALFTQLVVTNDKKKSD